MPTFDKIGSIKINLYSGDHRPPHIHASYNEFEILIIIETLEIYSGFLPSKQFRIVIDWIKENQEWANTIFYELNPSLL